MENKTTGNKPEKKYRAGGITATIWANNGTNKAGEKIIYRTISVERNYKDKEDNWKSTNSLRVNDLPKARLVIDKAYEYLVLKSDTDNLSADIGQEVDEIF